MKRRRSSCVPLKWKNCRLPYEQRISTNRSAPHATKPCLHCPARKTATYRTPVVVFGGTFRKTGEPAPPMRDYSGLVLLEVNHLSDLQEAVQIRQQAAMMPQTLLAFVGFSGKSVKIVIPFTLPDGTLPRSPEQVKRFHSQAYLTAVKYYQPQLGRNITLKEPVLQHGCRMSYDPQPVYNPDAVASGSSNRCGWRIRKRSVSSRKNHPNHFKG